MNISGSFGETARPLGNRKNVSSANAKTNAGADFAEVLQAKSETAAKADRLIISGARTEEKSTSAEDMSMTEYQLYIYSKISKLTAGSPRSGGYTAVFISDEGFEAMKNDPEYEKQVLDTVRASVCSNRYGRSDRKHYSVHYIGATKEESRSEHWSDIPAQTMTAEERRSIERKRFYALQKYRNEKAAKYRIALRENSIKKAELETEHIKGNYDDFLYAQKNICASSHVSRLFLWWK
ncbi:MAG: hypothetical protein NC395_08175 [Prevotella sp.]|nr:hypothetical protein [Prevotella sp.]